MLTKVEPMESTSCRRKEKTMPTPAGESMRVAGAEAEGVQAAERAGGRAAGEPDRGPYPGCGYTPPTRTPEQNATRGVVGWPV